MNDSKAFSPAATSCLAIDGSKIKALRESKKLTQLYVATCLGVTVDTISRWENGRSPNIKLENAEKLAEVLEISLAEITDSSEALTEGPADQAVQPGSQHRQLVKLLWSVIPLALLIVVSSFYFAGNKQPASRLAASRLLPRHASPHQPFPVLIKVEAGPVYPISFIVKEFLPMGCQTVKGEPPLMGSGPAGSTIKWLSNAEDEDPLYFAYLAQADQMPQADNILTFRGEVMVQGHTTQRQTISGSDSLAITNSHWADSNQDKRIDDEEILTIYNSFDILQDLGVDIEEIRQIWAGKGYSWDAENKKFVVIP